jgi:hypothetical protein
LSDWLKIYWIILWFFTLFSINFNFNYFNVGTRWHFMNALNFAQTTNKHCQRVCIINYDSLLGLSLFRSMKWKKNKNGCCGSSKFLIISQYCISADFWFFLSLTDNLSPWWSMVCRTHNSGTECLKFPNWQKNPPTIEVMYFIFWILNHLNHL